ncbi:MAG: hypothetical protein V4460_10875 [Pseudomonadota bacterium]|jgi:hypothetical protein
MSKVGKRKGIARVRTGKGGTPVSVGCAEVVAELISNRKRTLPLYRYGPAHDMAIRQRLRPEMRASSTCYHAVPSVEPGVMPLA